jgi:hypothetical protein
LPSTTSSAETVESDPDRIYPSRAALYGLCNLALEPLDPNPAIRVGGTGQHGHPLPVERYGGFSTFGSQSTDTGDEQIVPENGIPEPRAQGRRKVRDMCMRPQLAKRQYAQPRWQHGRSAASGKQLSLVIGRHGSGVGDPRTWPSHHPPLG